ARLLGRNREAPTPRRPADAHELPEPRLGCATKGSTMTNTDTEREMVSDADIQAMLEAFSGSAEPVLSRARRRHHMTRRALIFVAAGLAILGLVVPGSLALVGTFSETPQQFINDENQPLNAREVVEQYMTQLDRLNSGATTRQRAVVPTLSSVQRVVTANTPEGEYGVYALGFS